MPINHSMHLSVKLRKKETKENTIIKLTAIAGGRPPRTSPSPPVLLQGPTSVPTNIKFIPLPQTMIPEFLASLLLNVLLLARLAVTFAMFLIRSSSTWFKDLNPSWAVVHFIRPSFALASDPEVTPQLASELVDAKLEAATVAIADLSLDLLKEWRQIDEAASLRLAIKAENEVLRHAYIDLLILHWTGTN